MSYAVKELFLTLQGEGANSGRVAVFCRFSGCNLWSGREEDRERGTGSCSRWCDTDFVGTDGSGGGRFEASELAKKARELWGARENCRPLIVCTGGEPLLQLDTPLIEALHLEGFEIAVETNGTIAVPEGIDWVCVSPKAGTELVVRRGDEIKVVVPQDCELSEFAALDFEHHFLQPMDGPHRADSQSFALTYCLAHPQWRLSLQSHKFLGIP